MHLSVFQLMLSEYLWASFIVHQRHLNLTKKESFETRMVEQSQPVTKQRYSPLLKSSFIGADLKLQQTTEDDLPRTQSCDGKGGGVSNPR